jgi:hypothetical protein
VSDPLPPGIVFDRDGLSTFMIVDFDAVMDVTDEHPTLQGGGYTWTAIARAIAARDGDGLLKGIDLDPEADTFVARCADRAALVRLAAALQLLFEDPARLRALLDELGPELVD